MGEGGGPEGRRGKRGGKRNFHCNKISREKRKSARGNAMQEEEKDPAKPPRGTRRGGGSRVGKNVRRIAMTGNTVTDGVLF